MTNVKTEDKWQNAREQAQAQFELIREMVQDLEWAESEADSDDTFTQARQRILEDALSVEVRSGWYNPDGRSGKLGALQSDPAEYRILLCTGGPAVQITGKLSEHVEPETARLEIQDWFLPWTEYRPSWNSETMYAAKQQEPQDVLLAYARQFYFGE